MPGRLGLSFRYAPSRRLHVGADAARVFWADTGEGRRNQFDTSVHAQVDVIEVASVSFGVFSQGRNFFSKEFAEVFDYSGRAIFVTLGGVVTFDRFRLDAVIADSHLLGASAHRQTVLKFGASVEL